MSVEKELASYLSEAMSWDADRAAQSRRSARIAWTVAGAGWVCTGMATAALLILMPLKRVDPFVIRVSETTGVIDVVPTYTGQAALPETVTRYFLTHYVSVCERFNFATAESDYEECGTFHGALRNQAWYEQWARANPSSPLNVFKDGTTVRVQVTSLSFFKRASGVDDLAQVRYVKTRRAGGTGDEQNSYWIATVQYATSRPSTDPKVRQWNPLGLKVIDFRSEREVLPGAPSQATSVANSLEESAP
jgi:type IV secretion system protein VirB8